MCSGEGGSRHAQACRYNVHAGAGVGVGVTRVGGGPADSMSAAFCPVELEGRRGGSRREGAGEGPRPRPATKTVKADAQLRFDAHCAHLVMTQGQVRDVIVKDRADSVCIDTQTAGCEDVVDLRPTRLLSAVHVFNIFAEVGMRTTKTGRRAPPFTALGARFGLSCRCG